MRQCIIRCYLYRSVFAGITRHKRKGSAMAKFPQSRPMQYSIQQFAGQFSNHALAVCSSPTTNSTTSKKTAGSLSRNCCYRLLLNLLTMQWRASPCNRRNNSIFSAFLNWTNDGKLRRYRRRQLV